MQELPDDKALIKLTLQGQQQAFASIVMRYQQYVFTLALRYVNNRELAEELAQDVFVKAYRCLADFKGESKFSTWLYTIVNTTCLSYLRKKKEQSISLDNDNILALAENNVHNEKASDRLEQKTQKELLNKAIKLLPEADARVITLFYQAEQSIEEIGIIMGIDANNAKVRLFRARHKLKEILERKYSKELI
jgi:RNA polymerase sigma-70 factor (ECF subfamily)